MYNTTIKHSFISYLIGLSLFFIKGFAFAEDPSGMEKCYGVAKAGQNDCDPSATNCDKSVIDGDPNYYIYLPKGMCNKLVGGMTMLGGGPAAGTGMENMANVPASANTGLSPTAPYAPTTSLPGTPAPATTPPSTTAPAPATTPPAPPSTAAPPTPSATAPTAPSGMGN